jgi:hypothetical protein
MSKQMKQVKVPILNNRYLIGVDLENENKLFNLICQILSEKEKLEVLSLSVDQILEQAISAEQLISASKRNHYLQHYRSDPQFWLTLAELVEHRQKYINRYIG